MIGRRLRPALLFLWGLSGCATVAAGRPDLRLLIAQAAQLHFVASFDAATQTMVVASGTGKPALVAVHLAAASRPRIETIATAVEWPIAPTLSPGGRYLVHGARRGADNTTRSRLLLLDRQTGQSRVLLEAGTQDEAEVVAIAPTGQRVAFDVKFPGAPHELRIADIEPPGPVQRLALPGGARAPAFAPDGRTLYFLSGRCLLAATGVEAPPEELLCLPATHAPPSGPFPITVSPDGRRIALTVQAPECLGIAVIDVAARTWSMPDPHECGWRPVFSERARATIAYIHLDPATNDRMPALRDLDTGVRSLTGLREGVTYAVAAVPDGTVLALAATPTHPPTLWRAHPANRPGPSELLYAPMSNRELAALVGNAGRTTREIAIAEDGTRVPLILFRPTGASARRGPALLWVHAGWNGKDDVSPRWKQEIQYLLQLGYTVAGVNYRGSTGYGNAWTAAGLLPDGKPDLDRMAVDARAAARYLRERDYVDPSRLYVMSVSWGGRVAARLVASQPGWFRGAVQWSASSNVWQDAGAGAAAGSFPPLLVVAGTLDRMADQEHQLALRPAAAYRRIEWFWVEDGHSMVLEQSRTVALQRVADFLRATQAP